MWRLRAELRITESSRASSRTISLQEIFQGWCKAPRKLQKAEQVLQSSNRYRAAKILAPKAPKKRMQLRDRDGKIQTTSAEFEQTVQFFQELYSGPPAEHIVIDTPIHFSEDEVKHALRRLSTAKVMPTVSAPAALWRLMERPAAKILQQQYNQVFSGGQVIFPDPCNVSELVLIPKPFKPMKSPADLRPIALLPPEIKVLSPVLAERIRPYALQLLADIQFHNLRASKGGPCVRRRAG